MEMYEVLVEAGQSVYDIAVQEYADVSGVWLLLADNPTQCPDLNATLVPGAKIAIRQFPNVSDVELMNYFRNNKIQVNCGNV
jgi:hypothetical protein